MNKLQLYITMSQDGAYKTMVEINPDTYVKSWVTDLRQAVSQVAYPPMEKAIFYMVKYIDSGVFIVVLRTIPKTPGNHLAAWIFIPYSLRIPNKDVVQTVDFITQKVSNPEMKGKDLSEINEVLERRYEEDLQAPVFPPSQGITYAYRYYGPRVSLTLADLIGPYLYQTPYLPFSGVLIVDHDITNDIAGTNLTSAPLDDMAVLLPPPRITFGGRVHSYHIRRAFRFSLLCANDTQYRYHLAQRRCHRCKTDTICGAERDACAQPKAAAPHQSLC